MQYTIISHRPAISSVMTQNCPHFTSRLPLPFLCVSCVIFTLSLSLWFLRPLWRSRTSWPCLTRRTVPSRLSSTNIQRGSMTLQSTAALSKEGTGEVLCRPKNKLLLSQVSFSLVFLSSSPAISSISTPTTKQQSPLVTARHSPYNDDSLLYSALVWGLSICCIRFKHRWLWLGNDAFHAGRPHPTARQARVAQIQLLGLDSWCKGRFFFFLQLLPTPRRHNWRWGTLDCTRHANITSLQLQAVLNPCVFLPKAPRPLPTSIRSSTITPSAQNSQTTFWLRSFSTFPSGRVQ